MREPTDRTLALAALTLAAGVLLSFHRLHSDNNDASLYVLIGRTLARDRTPFALYYPRVLGHARFFEHPPLFFWLEAAALRLVPSFDLRLIGLSCGLITVGSTFALGRELLGGRGALYGCLVLVATDAFSNYQPLARLDPPLTAAFTASVALIVTSRGSLWRVLAGGLVAGAGALVKGPVALEAPAVAAILLFASGDHRALGRPACWTACLLGTLGPPAAFLAYDSLALAGAWWHGYVHGQLIESAVGARRGGLGPWPLLKNALVGRFWPGLPLALLALLRVASTRASASSMRPAVRWGLLGWAFLVYLTYASSGRPYWWYLMPAYPALALLAGTGIEDLAGARRAVLFETFCWRVELSVGFALLVLLPLKLFRPLEQACPLGDLPGRARALAKGGTVALVVDDYSTRVTFAEHCECDPLTEPSLEAAAREHAAVVLSRSSRVLPPPWKNVASQGDWSLLEPR